MTSKICALEHANDANRFGGKASGLQWLFTQGYHSAPGFVVAVDAFSEHINHHHAKELIAQLKNTQPSTPKEEITSLCTRIQEWIIATTLSDSFSNELHREVRRLKKRPYTNTVWIVRSSAVGEDGAHQSFAGQYHSVLNVNSEAALEDAILQVWASSFRSSAWLYALQHGTPSTKMAVIVQQQVDAMFSGVLFTRDPVSTNDECMRVEYCKGLADALVSGSITPVSEQILRNPNVVNENRTFPISNHSESVQEKENGAQQSFEPTLSQLNEQFLSINGKLISTALNLEKAAGKPLDIEWCVDNKNQLIIVQCRPITTDYQTNPELWTNANIGENFPGPVVPFLASFVPRGYAAYFSGLGRAVGVSQDRFNAAEDALQKLVGLQAGRLYYNLSNIVSVLHAIPGGAWLADGFNVFTGTQGSPSPSIVRWSRLSQLRQGLAVAVRLPLRAMQLNRGLIRFESIVDSYAARTHPSKLASLNKKELAKLLQEFLHIRCQCWTPAALSDAAAMVSYNLLKQLLNRWFANEDQAQLQNALLQGLPKIVTTTPVEALWMLAEQAQKDGVLLSLLTNNKPARVWERLPKEAPVFYADFLQYLDTWGFRYSGELMLTQPTPAENPLPVIQLLQTYLSEAGLGPIARSAQSAAARTNTTRSIETELTPSALLRKSPLPSRARLFRAVLKAAQTSICLRERARMKQALLYTRLRHVCLALGNELLKSDSLPDRDAVFFLTIDEAIDRAEASDVSLPEKSLLKTATQKMISERREEYERCHSLHPPEQMNLMSGVSWTEENTNDEILQPSLGNMTGLGACAGTFCGQASVVLDVSAIGKIEKNTVLVTRQTDPGWAPVFFLIKGLVVERGGMLSHGAIIAREYGIPAVVGVAQATSRIQCGDHLLVDGNKGMVAWVN